MVKQFFSGFTGIIKSTGIVILCLAVCAGLCFAFVWPVWYLSQSHPDLFSTAVITFFCLLIIYFLAMKIRSGIKNNADKKAKKLYIFKLLLSFIRIILSISLLAASINSIMTGNKITGLILFLASIFLFGFTGSLIQFFLRKIK